MPLSDTTVLCIIIPRLECLTALQIDGLEKWNNIKVRIDYKVSGVGSNNCGPELIEKYKLQKCTFVLSFFI